jgi:hypothetical protein
MCLCCNAEANVDSHLLVCSYALSATVFYLVVANFPVVSLKSELLDPSRCRCELSFQALNRLKVEQLLLWVGESKSGFVSSKRCAEADPPAGAMHEDRRRRTLILSGLDSSGVLSLLLLSRSRADGASESEMLEGRKLSLTESGPKESEIAIEDDCEEPNAEEPPSSSELIPTR